MRYGDIKYIKNLIEYDQGANDDDEFVKMEIISPHNNQHLIDAWVPKVMEEKLQAEVDLTKTGRYHQWSSFISRELYNQEFKNFVTMKKEIERFFMNYKKNFRFIQLNEKEIDWSQDSNGNYYIKNAGIEIVI